MLNSGQTKRFAISGTAVFLIRAAILCGILFGVFAIPTIIYVFAWHQLVEWDRLYRTENKVRFVYAQVGVVGFIFLILSAYLWLLVASDTLTYLIEGERGYERYDTP